MSASPYSWQAHRRWLLHTLCLTLSRRLGKGGQMMRESVRLARKHHGKQLDADHRLQLSGQSLRRHHRAWLRSGGDLSAFDLRYRSVRLPVVTDAMKRAFVGACLEPGVRSKSQARLLTRKRLQLGWKGFPSLQTFCRIGGSELQQALSAMFRERSRRRYIDTQQTIRLQARLSACLVGNAALPERSRMPQDDFRGVRTPPRPNQSISNSAEARRKGNGKRTPTPENRCQS